MRLLPMKEPDRSWRSIKGQWKKDAESVGEDFSTFSTGSFTAYDGLTKDGDHPSLYCLSDGERIHATCQVSRLMMSKFPSPILRARFILVSPVYELGIADAGQYAQMMVALFSGMMPVPGGMGVAEAGFTVGLQAIGVPSAIAVSTAISMPHRPGMM